MGRAAPVPAATDSPIHDQKAKQRAAEIKAAYAAHVANLKAVQNSAFKACNAESEKLWNSYKADRKSDYRKEFAIQEPRQDKGDQHQFYRDEFREAASGTAKPERELKADQNQGNGADRTPTPEN
jgi:hypothetical protein